jgi:putative heme-binding domain-containing protein
MMNFAREASGTLTAAVCGSLVSLFSLLPLVAADRVPWTTSRIEGSPDPPKEYHVQRVYPELQFDQPVELMPLADTGKMMLLEVNGKLYTFDDEPACATADLALDLSPLIDEFRRALGFAVHPNFAENRQIFVVYVGNPVARPDGTRLSRFTVTDGDPIRVDPASEEILLTWASGGHNGCAIRFDSEGLLYFSTGDGARPYPPDEYDVSQDLSDLRSTICRIDVDKRDGDQPYSIPQDNPFIDTKLANGKEARKEIWAYGFRNPWRFTIAPETDQILCGDVGWELWELVFDVRRGGNYGWSIFEGPQPIRSDIQPGPTPISKPLVAYPHAVGQSVTGGVVYRGSQHPELQGAYLYGDYVTGLLWGMRHEGDQVTWNPVLAETGLTIITFTESRSREVLVVSYDGGIYRLVKNSATGKPSQFPRKLSETGLFTSTQSLQVAPGVIPYRVAAKAWQNGATSQSVVAVPGNETIEIREQQRRWTYPAGTVFAKTLSKDATLSQDAKLSKEVAGGSAPRSLRIETQILHFDGINWHPYSYLWREDQTDADLVDAEGLTTEFAGDASDASAADRSTWRIHHRAQCRACHSVQNGGAVGFTLENLEIDGQVDDFVDAGILDRRAPKQWNITSMVDPQDVTAELSQRARSYLAANCAHCHRRGGGGTVPLDLTYFLPSDEINAVDVDATQGAFGIRGAKVIKPGDPYRSILFYRMATAGTGHMPKLWSGDNPSLGLKLVHDWIRSLADGESAEEIQPIDAPEVFTDTAASLQLFSQLMLNRDRDDRLRVAEQAAEQGNLVTAALFERFLPQQQRRKRLGSDIDVAEILAIQGDAKIGRERFFDAQSGQCIQCHRLQGSGQMVGPDLDEITNKPTRRQQLESILEPSKVMDPKYNNYSVVTVDGAIVTGLKVRESEQAVIIKQANGKDQRILKDEIDSIRIQPKSLMPTGLAADMTAQELADLLAFLGSLN